MKVIEEEQIVIPIQSNIPSIFPFAKEPAENIVSPYCVTKTKKTVYRKKKNQKKERMEKPDDIRKKIKVGFHYSLNKRINEILESVNAKKYSFKRLPQEIITCVTKEENKQIKNEDLNRLYLKADILMANRYNKRYSISLVIREVEIKITMRHYFTLDG